MTSAASARRSRFFRSAIIPPPSSLVSSLRNGTRPRRHHIARAEVRSGARVAHDCARAGVIRGIDNELRLDSGEGIGKRLLDALGQARIDTDGFAATRIDARM